MAGKSSDKALCGLAGEFLTAGQLLKRDLLACVTMGNAKAVDLLVHNERTGRDFRVQVKTSRGKAGWFIKVANPDHIYVFVKLNRDEPDEFFVISGRMLVGDYARFFGKGFDPENPKGCDGVDWKPVQEFRDNWKVFEQ